MCWPTVHSVLIVSSDRFVSRAKESRALPSALCGAVHEALAVEMEGDAVALVCADYDAPFAAMRRYGLLQGRCFLTDA